MLKQRIMTAVVLFVVGVSFLFVLPQAYMPAFVLLVLGLMAFEWAGLCGWQSQRLRIGYALLTLLLAGELWYWLPNVTHTQLWQMTSFTATVLVLGSVFVFARQGAWTGAWALYARWFGVFWLINFALVFLSVFEELGVWWLLFALSLVWITDTGAYFSGKRFGSRKLAPLVSPGKTWEGVWGGVALASLFSVMVAVALDKPLLSMLLIGFVVSFLSIYGDLFESALKRQAGVKDSSQMLPGHGGWLDRFDALLLALPVFWLLWQGLAL